MGFPSFVNRRVALANENARTVILAVPALDHRGQRLHGRFDALLRERLLVHATRQPFLDGARALARLGISPLTHIAMRRPGDLADSLRSTVGDAAALTVKERDRGGLLFEQWEADSRSLEGAPIKKIGEAVPWGRPHG
jgi:hypothetical protein